MQPTNVKMKLFFVMIVVNCLIDVCLMVQTTTLSANETLLESSVSLSTINQTEATNNFNTSSSIHSDAKTTKRLSCSENKTEIYLPDIKREALSAQSGWENKTRSDEATVVHTSYNDFGLTELAGMASICFIVFAVFGYFGFVFLRRYLVNRYGNRQSLITEEEYDTSDLRNFSI